MTEYPLQNMTEKQKRAITAIVENLSEGLTETELAKRAGVSRQHLWELRKKPEFQMVLREAVRDELAGKVDFAARKLLEKVEEGDTKCLATLLEITGLHIPIQRSANLNVQAQLQEQLEGKLTREFLWIDGEKKYIDEMHPQQIAREYIKRMRELFSIGRDVALELVKEEYQQATTAKGRLREDY